MLLEIPSKRRFCGNFLLFLVNCINSINYSGFPEMGMSIVEIWLGTKSPSSIQFGIAAKIAAKEFNLKQSIC